MRGTIYALAASALSLFAPQEVVRAESRLTPPQETRSAEDPLLTLVDEAILRTSKRHLDFQQHTPWQILHGLLALREDYVLRDGDKMVNAIEWISNEARFRNRWWFEATPHGARAHPYSGTPYEFEGHVNQSLAIIAMCNLPLKHEFTVAGGRTVTMADMIEHAKMTVNSREEITWTLWFLTHYVDQDAQWNSAAGEPWSMEQLVRMQVRADPTRGPCGGTHGLFALAYARNSYLQKHGQLRGAWLEADQKVQQYVAAARAMQNPDGTFATEFFRSRGFSQDFNERLKSTGHMLEWLMMALPRRQLDEAWVRRGVQAVATDLVRNSTRPADCGPLYHALHSLVLYRQRVQPDFSPPSPEELAAHPDDEPAGPLTFSGSDDEAMPFQPPPPEPLEVPLPAKVATTPQEKPEEPAPLPAALPVPLPIVKPAQIAQQPEAPAKPPVKDEEPQETDTMGEMDKDRTKEKEKTGAEKTGEEKADKPAGEKPRAEGSGAPVLMPILKLPKDSADSKPAQPAKPTEPPKLEKNEDAEEPDESSD